MKVVPEVLADHILPFNWDVKAVWKEEAEAVRRPLEELRYLMELPFWSSVPGAFTMFDVSPREVMEFPDRARHQYQRVIEADVSFPIDLLQYQGKQWILDGLHRVARMFLEGQSFVHVRMHPESIIPRISTS